MMLNDKLKNEILLLWFEIQNLKSKLKMIKRCELYLRYLHTTIDSSALDPIQNVQFPFIVKIKT